jgi:hypothetical protein
MSKNNCANDNAKSIVQQGPYKRLCKISHIPILQISLHSSFSMLLFLELLSSLYFWELHGRYPILIIASLKFELPIRGRAIELEFFFFFFLFSIFDIANQPTLIMCRNLASFLANLQNLVSFSKQIQNFTHDKKTGLCDEQFLFNGK